MSIKKADQNLVRPNVFLIVALILCCSATVVAGVVDFSPGLLRYVTNQWGKSGEERLVNWRTLELSALLKHQVSRTPQVIDKATLQTFNIFWNKVPYYSDLEHWGMDDYWASPVEMQASNGGDCEDYSIAKYFSLRELGIPVQNIRITYVRALKLNVAHMVLAYYPTPDADPYILDNLTDKLLPASQRTDLEPVYSFNDEDLWAAGAASFKGKSSQIRLWRELLDKMEKERHM